MTAPLLEVRNLTVRYGSLTALDRVSLAVGRGEVVAVLGPNGAGKSSLLRAVMGLAPAVAGDVTVDGVPLGSAPPEARARRGLGYAPEGRRIFPGLTVDETLAMACRAGRAERRRRLGQVRTVFPQLAERADDRAWLLSGGQQQMLSIGRALMGAPALLMLDEPSLGLAPRLVAELFAAFRRIARDGTAILVAEQNVQAALGLADRACALAGGRVVAEGPADKLAGDPQLRGAYLGS